MTVFYNLLSVVAAATAILLLDEGIFRVEACRCAELSVCEGLQAADVVVHGTVLRSKGNARGGGRNRPSNKSITYTFGVTSVYKGEPPEGSGSRKIKFTTEGSSATCGVTLDKGEEYLLGLYQTDDGLTANACGLVDEWSSVTDEDRAAVEAGCEEDPCDGSCGEFQECLLHGKDEYYCADVCEPSPCAEDEVCYFNNIVCIRDPCPASALCKPSSA